MKMVSSTGSLVGAPHLIERFRAVVGFLAAFERPNFDPGEFVPPREIEPGVFHVPFARLSDTAQAFVQSVHDSGLVLTDFDGPAWAGTPRAKKMMRDAEMLARATPRTLARLLTVCIRRDRFVEGSLLSDFQSGLILRIVRRAAVLLEAKRQS
jgi:hypothetical protein